MSVKLLNQKTGVTAVCERADWTQCRDHQASKGWQVWTPNSMSRSELESMGLAEKKVNRNNPPWIIVIESDDNTRTFLDENGKLYTKMYDDYGNGAGSFPSLKLFKGKKIKAAVEAAWAEHDRQMAEKAEREKDNPYKEYGV